METVIFSLSRRAEQTFTRIRLLDQLPGVDLLPCSSLPYEMSDLRVPYLIGTLISIPHSYSGMTCMVLLPFVSQGLSLTSTDPRQANLRRKQSRRHVAYSLSFYAYLLYFTFSHPMYIL